jgi:glycosyltransferase involved in cell wall biosynthesis
VSKEMLLPALSSLRSASAPPEGRRLKVGLVCLRGAINIASWRGNANSINAALTRQGVDVVQINLKKERLPLVFKAKQLLLRNVLKQGYTRHREPSMLRHYGALVSDAAKTHGIDVILALTAMPIAQTESDVPIAFWNDAPFAGMLNWYPEFSSMSSRTAEHGHAMEFAAHRRAALAIYSSRWAADMAVSCYGADPRRVRVVDFGPNIDVTWGRDYIAERIKARLEPPHRLVWIGVDWYRKGGDVAVAVAKDLYEAGFPVELTIAGTVPPRSVAKLPYVRSLGFLGKEAVQSLLDSAAFLLLPSRADLSPIVFSEASALGVPVISRPIGGIPEIIRDQKNGMLFAETVAPREIAQYIRETVSLPAVYRDLGLNAYNEFETRLNWDVAARRLCDMFRLLAFDTKEGS